MRVSLKKARRIESAFSSKLEELTIGWNRSRDLEVSTDKNQALALVESRYEEVENQVLKLVAGINEIRSRIRETNESSSVNKKIQEISNLERQMAVIKFLRDYTVKAEYGPRTQYGRDGVSFDKKEESEKRLNQLKFKISELKDSTNGQNASLEVELSKATQEVADELGIPV